MARHSKCLSLLFVVVILAFSLLLIIPIGAQTIPKPAIPEFAINFLPSSGTFNITNPNTGVNNTVSFDNSTIQLVIKNQPFSPYVDTNGNVLDLYYNVSAKMPNGNITYHPPDRMQQATNSDYTVMVFFTNQMYNLYEQGTNDFILLQSGKIEFSVQASIGYYNTTYYYVSNLVAFPIYGFRGVSSDWSGTQTITIPTSNTSPSPSVPEFPITLSLVAVLVVVSLLLVMSKRRLTIENMH